MDLSRSRMRDELGHVSIFKEFLVLLVIGIVSGFVGVVGVESALASLIGSYVSIGLLGGYVNRAINLVRGEDPDVLDVFKYLANYKYVLKVYLMIILLAFLALPVLILYGVLGVSLGFGVLFILALVLSIFLIYLSIVLEFTNYYLVDMGSGLKESYDEARKNLKGKYGLVIRTRIKYKIVPFLLALVGLVLVSVAFASSNIALGTIILVLTMLVTSVVTLRNEVKVKLVETYIYNNFI